MYKILRQEFYNDTIRQLVISCSHHFSYWKLLVFFYVGTRCKNAFFVDFVGGRLRHCCLQRRSRSLGTKRTTRCQKLSSCKFSPEICFMIYYYRIIPNYRRRRLKNRKKGKPFYPPNKRPFSGSVSSFFFVTRQERRRKNIWGNDIVGDRSWCVSKKLFYHQK